jgi:hypothetical protein
MLDSRRSLTIDDDVLQGARQIADVSGRSLGTVISDLARQTLVAPVDGSMTDPTSCSRRAHQDQEHDQTNAKGSGNFAKLDLAFCKVKRIDFPHRPRCMKGVIGSAWERLCRQWHCQADEAPHAPNLEWYQAVSLGSRTELRLVRPWPSNRFAASSAGVALRVPKIERCANCFIQQGFLLAPEESDLSADGRRRNGHDVVAVDH